MSSSSSSSSPSSSHQWKPDVFVNFRGKDIRIAFISHLFHRLDEAGISCFKDDNREDAGKEIEAKLLEAIHQARIALVVFTANYAESVWCLNELVEILRERQRKRENPKLVVIPIFHISTDKVSIWAKDGKFEKALGRVDRAQRAAKKEEWRNALNEAKKITGYELNGHARDEAELIEMIVKQLKRLLKEIHSPDSAKNAIPHTHSVEVFGPFGGGGEKSWKFGDIKGIVVHRANFIKSITFEVDNATNTEPQTNYGGNDGEITFKVKLRNGEYITSFAGYLKNANDRGTVINSLTFQTNKRVLGPIGREEGEYFSLKSKEAGKVIRFFGRSGHYLQSIGAKVEPCYPFKSVGLFVDIVPPLINNSNAPFWDDGNKHTDVRKITIELDSTEERFIRSIEFQYEDENNKLSQLKTHGGTNGNKRYEIRNKNIKTVGIRPDEYLTSISGYAYQRDKNTIGGIRSLTFQTNKRTMEPIGDEKGTHFSSPATGGKIVGFYGWSDKHLHGIGAHFEPISHFYPIKSIGPFGGLGGCAWDDGRFYRVRQVEVMHDDHIGCIMIVYDLGSGQNLSFKHGNGNGGTYPKLDKVTLDYPREYLTSISGYMREDGAIIQSLTFYSNRRSHGPFGKETRKGRFFWYPSTGSKIIGFHGTCDDKTLKSIGVYAEPILELYPFKTVGPFGGCGGTLWDDGVHTDVRGFRFSFGNVIHSIGIEYDNNGSFVLGSEHGEKQNDGYEEVNLDFPKERLISMSAFVKGIESTPDTTIHDLKIRTTKKTYGPFAWTGESGNVRGTSKHFFIPLEEDDGRRIVGFFGRAGSHLNSIGARLEPY